MEIEATRYAVEDGVVSGGILSREYKYVVGENKNAIKEKAKTIMSFSI